MSTIINKYSLLANIDDSNSNNLEETDMNLEEVIQKISSLNKYESSITLSF